MSVELRVLVTIGAQKDTGREEGRKKERMEAGKKHRLEEREV